MIEINLLPKEFRKKRKTKSSVSYAFPVVPTAVGVVVFTLVLHAVLVGVTFVKNRQTVRYEEVWGKIAPDKEKFDKVSSEVAKMEKALKFVKGVSSSEISWYRLMGGLNKAVVPGVWLSRLNLEVNGKNFSYRDPSVFPTRMILHGYVLGKSEVATAGVARFINSLKNTPDFFDYFREVELIDMTYKPVSGEETMFFRLKCEFPARAVSSKKASKKKRRR
jgi:hypothetical protein